MNTDYSTIKVIGFDADDTLWLNESYFRESGVIFSRLLSRYDTENSLNQELFRTEIENLKYYGYGVKSYVLSMLECALEVSNGKVETSVLKDIITLGKEMLSKDVELINGVSETLHYLQEKYRLILITKGDLFDQERKLRDSGLVSLFHHVEVLSEKHVENYQNLLLALEIDAREFLMVGNSLKSDVLPLLELGAKAVHIPFETTWAHEMVDEHGREDEFLTLSRINELKNHL